MSSIKNDSLLSLLQTSLLSQNDIDDLSDTNAEYNYQINNNGGLDISPLSLALKSSSDDEYYANDATVIAQKILNLLKIKEDTKILQATVVSLGVFIIVLGIIMNILFNIFSLVKRRYTAYTLIMISMCSAYLLYLILYCFKLSVYLKDISKYHIYDTIQEWEYGLFLCQFINGFLLTCKLISRFSILALCVKRITTLFQVKNEEYYYLEQQQQQQQQKQQQNYHHDELNNDKNNNNNIIKSKLLKSFIKLFNLPLILILIIFIWLLSFLISIPVYLSYKLTEAHNSTTILCDSIYSFPDETHKYALNTFNYMIFGLLLPSVLIITLLATIFGLNCVYDLSLNEKINSNKNFLLVILFLIHFITTLPTEIYKYTRLSSIKKEILLDDNNLDETTSFIEKSILETISNPVASAKPYYYLQYLYISEFIIVPIVLSIYYILSTKRVSAFCSLYVKCFDCYEKGEEELCKKQNKHDKHDFDENNLKISASSSEHHHVTRSLLNDEKINENDDFNEVNVKTISGSDRIKIIRKTSASSNACSTNTTSSGSGILNENNNSNNNKPFNYNKPK